MYHLFKVNGSFAKLKTTNPIWISGKITKVYEIMPITYGILKMTFSVCAMLTMFKISHIRGRCENNGF